MCVVAKALRALELLKLLLGLICPTTVPALPKKGVI